LINTGLALVTDIMKLTFITDEIALPGGVYVVRNDTALDEGKIVDDVEVVDAPISQLLTTKLVPVVVFVTKGTSIEIAYTPTGRDANDAKF
jgi:hypothetical protein